jgi:hypothetical protein
MVFYKTVQFCFFQGSGNPMIVIINAQHNNFILSFTVMYDSQFFILPAYCINHVLQIFME